MPIDPKLRQAILATEPVLKDGQPISPAVSGDEVELEYYSDGLPKLPACLDRRPSIPEVA
jgi:hypothetical protein